ncbi:MAG: hypothetical protein AB7I48_28885 [Planctomycetaceae bacterium]
MKNLKSSGVPWVYGTMPLVVRKGVRVHDSIRDQIESRKRRSARRLDQFNCPDDLSRPMLRGGAIKYESAGRAVGTAGGGIGRMPQLVRELQLAEAIDAARRKVWVRTTGRQLVLRRLAWDDWQPMFFRLVDALVPARRGPRPLPC